MRNCEKEPNADSCRCRMHPLAKGPI